MSLSILEVGSVCVQESTSFMYFSAVQPCIVVLLLFLVIVLGVFIMLDDV